MIDALTCCDQICGRCIVVPDQGLKSSNVRMIGVIWWASLVRRFMCIMTSRTVHRISVPAHRLLTSSCDGGDCI